VNPKRSPLALVSLALWLVVAIVLTEAVGFAAQAPSGSSWQGAAMPELPTPLPAPQISKLLKRTDELFNSVNPRDALKIADRALAIADGSHDFEGLAEASAARAKILRALGQWAESVDASLVAAKAYVRVGSPNGIEELVRAAVILQKEEPDRARELVASAVQIAKTETTRPYLAAHQMVTVAMSIAEQGNVPVSQELFETALPILDKVAPDSGDLVNCQFNLALAYRDSGDWQKAKDSFRQTLNFFDKHPPGSSTLVQILSELAIAYGELQEFDQQEECIRRATELSNKLDPETDSAADALASLGKVEFSRGRSEKAKNLGERALILYLGQGVIPERGVEMLNWLASIALWQGKLGKAQKYAQNALSIQLQNRESALTPLTADIYDSLGEIAEFEANWNAAGYYYRKALDIREQFGPETSSLANSYAELGALAVNQQDFEFGTERLRKSMEILERIEPGSVRIADVSVVLAQLALMQEPADLGAAGKLLEQAEKIYAMNQGSVSDYFSFSLLHTELGRLEFSRGNLDAAEKELSQALEAQKRSGVRSRMQAGTLHLLAMVKERQQNIPEAEIFAQQAWETVRDFGAQVEGEETRDRFDSSVGVFARSLLRYQLKQGEIDSAFLTLEQGRAQALRRLLSERRNALASEGFTPEQTVTLAALQKSKEILQRALTGEEVAREAVISLEQSKQPNDISIVSAKKTLETKIERRKEEDIAYSHAQEKGDLMWQAIRQTVPSFQDHTVSLDQAEAIIPPDAVYLAFSVGKEETELFIVRPRSEHGSSDSALAGSPITNPALTVHSIHVSVEQLTESCRRLRNLARREGSDLNEVSRAARELFSLLFPGEAASTVLKAKRLIISPDGPLWDVPFALLAPDGDSSPTYLGNDRPISFAQSLTLYAEGISNRKTGISSARPVALIVGDPDFGQGSSMVAAGKASEAPSEYSLVVGSEPPDPLPETRAEATEVAGLYKTTPILGKEATEAAVRKTIEQADVIHFATHGYLDLEFGMSSGILLSRSEKRQPPGETSNDGVLQAWEVFSEFKLKADIVVLSACDTGKGENVYGEGIIGLTRAFQYAGAHSIVASLWKVSDASTVQLMKNFHANLCLGLDKDEALQKAMNGLQRNKKTAHPYYWAPFFLIGDPTPLSFTGAK
jgi:CHAT domain-containing protein